MKLSLHLTPKVTLAFVIFATMLLIGVGVLAYNSGRGALQVATISELASIATEKEAAFNAWVNDGLSRVTTLAEFSPVRANVNLLLTNRATSEGHQAHDTLISDLRSSTEANSPFLSLFVLDPQNGKIVASTEANDEGRFKEDRAYFINGRNAPYVQNVYYSLEIQEPSMTVSAPIRTTDGKLLAVLAGQLNLDVMSAIINRHSGLHQSDDTFLVNPSNLFVTQPRFVSDEAVLRRGDYTDTIKQCLAGGSGSTLADDYRATPAIIVFHWLPERQLCLIVKLDQAEAFEPSRTFGLSLVAIGAGVLLAASIVAILLARTITRPVLALQTGVARFGQGELNVRLPETSRDELGSLAHEFNTMADAIVEKEKLLQSYASDLEKRVIERTTKLAFLTEASAILSESFDYLTCLKKLAQIAVPQIADWCAIDILEEDGQLHRLAVVHTDPAKVAYAYEIQRRFPPDPNAPSGVYRVLNTGISEMVTEITDEMLVAGVKDPELLAITRNLGLKSAITVSLKARGQGFGIISLVMAESGRLYTMADRDLAEDLARRAALLIDNAKLYYNAQQLNAELEQRVADRTSQLVSSNKELEAFSYSVSHDLRAPLRALDGFSEVLQVDYRDVLDDEGRGYLDRIRAASQRMGHLIDDLINLSRLTRSEMHSESVNLSTIADHVVADLRAAQPEHSVEVVIQPSLIVQGDSRLLRIMLVNLLTNAWKFTSKTPHPHVEFGKIDENDATVYFIRDNGAGFDMAYVNKLFGAFQRLHKPTEFEGTGIGLATVQRIIQRHGGKIWAEGAVNNGATFYFSFQDHELVRSENGIR